MLTAMNTALTALNAESTAINVTGNNLANLNTTGFKGSSVVFDDLVSQSLNADGTTQIGLGVQTPTTERVFAQGGIVASSSSTDVAIQGGGFLIVKDPSSGATQFTRAGNLTVSPDPSNSSVSLLTTPAGDVIQGYPTGSTTLSNLILPNGALKPAAATNNISLNANLDATATAITGTITPGTTPPTYSTSIDVYDSQGTAHSLTINFYKTGANAWTWAPSVPAADLGTGGAVTASTATLTFDANGNLKTPTAGSEPTIKIAGLADSASDITLNFNLYNTSASGAVSPAFTQYAQTSGVSSETQDGNAAVELSKISVANGGMVQASYSDGSTVNVGQIAMANFVNPQSLIAVGNNNYQIGGLTSAYVASVPGAAGNGQIVGSALESSTVDIATEFTNLMNYQNSYGAASRVITTADTILQQTLQLISL